jgi:hypothetical protein
MVVESTNRQTEEQNQMVPVSVLRQEKDHSRTKESTCEQLLQLPVRLKSGPQGWDRMGVQPD